MANGDICVALAYSGDFVQARKRAREAHNGVAIGFAIPEEGSLLWFDMLAIPRDAPNAANAHLFINYLLEPGHCGHHNFIGFANANSRATPLLDASIVSDTIVYPPPGQQQRLFVQTEDSPNKRARLRASGRSSRSDSSQGAARTRRLLEMRHNPLDRSQGDKDRPGTPAGTASKTA